MANKTNMNKQRTGLLQLITVNIPRRGRGKPFQASILGTPHMVTRGTETIADSIDISGFKGKPIGELLGVAQEQGLDASEALAEGINAMLIRRARAGDPTLQEKLINDGFAGDPKEARLLAIHLSRMSKAAKVTPEAVLGLLKEVQANSDAAMERRG